MRLASRRWMLLLIAAIAIVLGLFWARGQALETKKDPLTKAQEWVDRSFGMKLEQKTADGNGLKVLEVRAGSPAAQAGVKAKDRVVAVGDKSVWHVYQLVELVAKRTRVPIVPVLVATGEDYHLVRLPLSGIRTPPPIEEEEEGHHH